MPTKTYMSGTSTVRENIAMLPKNMRNLSVRKALSKAGGIFKKDAKFLAPKETGVLKNSLAVKAKVPRDENKPAYVIVGAARGKKTAVEIRGKRVRKVKKVAKKTLALLPAGAFQKFRTPTRYLHLAEAHYGFMLRAQNCNEQAAMRAVEEKIAKEVREYKAGVKAPEDTADGE